MRWFVAVLLTFILLAPLRAEAFPKSTEDLIKHLETLGYTCKKENPDEDSLVVVTHESQLNFIFYEGGKGIAFSALFNLKPDYKDDPMPVLKKFNEIMEKGIWLPQLYMYESKDKSLTLRMQAWMPDIYEHKSFADFISRWQEDTLEAGQALKEFIK